MIHAKLYVVDDMLGVGSPNLTTAGVKRNLEVLCWLKSPELVENISRTLESIKDFKRVELNEIGTNVWMAPRRRKPRMANRLLEL